jgi:excisionase family DNA binding protein
MNQQFFMLTEESISKLAEQITANISKQLQPTTSALSEDEFLNIEELSKLIGLTKPTIYGHVHRKTIPFIKKGKMLRFSKKSILNWLEEGKSQSKSALEAKVNDYLAKKPLF